MPFSAEHHKAPSRPTRDWGLTSGSVFPMDCYLLSLFCFGYPPEMSRFPFLQTMNLIDRFLRNTLLLTILGSTLTQACLERIKSTSHFAFPNSEKFGCLFGLSFQQVRTFLVHGTHPSFLVLVYYVLQRLSTSFWLFLIKILPTPFSAWAKLLNLSRLPDRTSSFPRSRHLPKWPATPPARPRCGTRTHR